MRKNCQIKLPKKSQKIQKFSEFLSLILKLARTWCNKHYGNSSNNSHCQNLITILKRTNSNDSTFFYNSLNDMQSLNLKLHIITIRMLTSFRFHVWGLTMWTSLQIDEIFFTLFSSYWQLFTHSLSLVIPFTLTILKITHSFKMFQKFVIFPNFYFSNV